MTKSGHPRRTQRRSPGRAQATPRDLSLLLRFISEAQPVRATDLEVASGMSTQMIRRRARVLRDLGLLSIHVVSCEAPNLYTLAPGAVPHLLRLGVSDERIYVP